jgi:hypothetical protein
MRIPTLILALGATTVLAAGCASKEDPARNTIAGAETDLNEVRADGAKYAPEQLQAADAKLAAMKTDLANKKYDAVLRAAPKFKEDVNAVEDIAVAKQTQETAAAREWQDLNTEVPKLVDAIQNRVDNLKGSKLPKEVQKESFEAAKDSLETMKSQWAEATAAASAGNATEAADKGRAVQAKAKEVSEQLAMSAV